MDGALLVDKPTGWTSFDVVAKVRGVLKASGVNKPKVGHSGTLDPMATGLLVLLLGSYTKKAESLTKLDKVYKTTMRLGETSTTGDSEGKIEAVSDKIPDEGELKAAFQQFLGDIDQIPPIHSAIKINGKRAYELARKGETPEMKSRRVRIYSIDLLSYVYPEVNFDTKVSSGTYIRSLVKDIGEELGTGAYMSGLRREQIGEFQIGDAVPVEGLSAELIHNKLLLLPN